MSRFVGRKKELARLNNLTETMIPKLIVVKGRRRIGKSRLLQEFGNTIGKTYTFIGLAPEKGVTSHDQRIEFARQLEVNFGLRGIKTDDWGDLFWHLAERVKQGRVLVVLDEISWMATNDPTFLPKLKNAWEAYFKNNDEIILALCSSISIWIDENLLSSTGFMGRQSFTMTLNELKIDECLEFWDDSSQYISAQEKLLMLSVTGGVPRYLEEINPKLPTNTNIKNLCFAPGGILFQEFDRIFSDLFGGQKDLYKKICESLAKGPKDAMSIYKDVGMSGKGDDYKKLDNLALSGFITKDYTWHIKSGKVSKISSYRLSDNYCRFYLKYILPNKHKIERDEFSEIALTQLPNWSTIMGLQIENIILNNRHLIKNCLGISQQEVVCDNPYLQKATKAKQGCQIDYLIQTRFDTLYVCEIKYSSNEVGINVIDEMKNKISALPKGKNMSIRPVLIHCNTVADSVVESGFFAKIINFLDFLS